MEDADVLLGRDDPGGVTGILEDLLIEFMDLLVLSLLNWSFDLLR